LHFAKPTWGDFNYTVTHSYNFLLYLNWY